MKNIIKEKGITLIALVVTIIILLILAGIAIRAVTGDNGLFKKADESARISDVADTKEQIKMELTTAIIDKTGSYNNQDVIKAVKKVTEKDVKENAETVKSKKGNDVDISDLWKSKPDISFTIIYEGDPGNCTHTFKVPEGTTYREFFQNGNRDRILWFLNTMGYEGDDPESHPLTYWVISRSRPIVEWTDIELWDTLHGGIMVSITSQNQFDIDQLCTDDNHKMDDPIQDGVEHKVRGVVW